MAATLLTIPESCRIRIIRFCLLQHIWIVVDPSNSDTPGLLRTCTQLRKESSTIFYKENTFLLMLETLALPQGHWIHKVADVSSRPVITRLRQEKKLGNPQKWLSAFYNEHTKIQWIPFRPNSGSRSRHPLVNVLRHGFQIANVLKAQQRDNWEKSDDEGQRSRRCAELILQMWCETAKRAGTLGDHLRGREVKESYKKTMEMFHHYHCDLGSSRAFEAARTKSLFEEAFTIVDVMQGNDWRLVKKVLRYWFQTICRESVERLCNGDRCDERDRATASRSFSASSA